MNLIDRMIGKTILQTILIVLLATAGVEFFIMMVSELTDIGHNHYSLIAALWYALLNVPDQVYQFFPMVGLLGVLMGLGLLASHSELIVLQSAGMSPLRITLSTLKTIGLLLVLMTVLGEVLAPKVSAYAADYKQKKIQIDANAAVIAYDLWLRMQHNFLYVAQIDKDNILHHLSWYQFDAQNNLLQENTAVDAYYSGSQWIARQVQQTYFLKNKTQSFSQNQQLLPFAITPKLLVHSMENPNDLSLQALEQSLQFHKTNHLQNNFAQLFFWRRILQPLASLVMMLLAIPFIFGPLRQVSQSLRAVLGISVGFCFYYLNAFFGPIVLLFHWAPWFGALLPTVIFGLFGIGLLMLRQHN